MSFLFKTIGSRGHSCHHFFQKYFTVSPLIAPCTPRILYHMCTGDFSGLDVLNSISSDSINPQNSLFSCSGWIVAMKKDSGFCLVDHKQSTHPSLPNLLDKIF